MRRFPILGLCALAALLLARVPAQAQAIDPFLGTYVGRATVYDQTGQAVEDRDMDIVIERAKDQDAFTITWVNVTLVDGRRDLPGVKRRVDQVTLYPTDRPGIYVEEQRGSMFQRRKEADPMKGDPIRWARIQDGQIGAYSMVVQPDGSYELQIYERTLTQQGLDILFQRIVDGAVVRQISGHTVRVEEQTQDAAD